MWTGGAVGHFYKISELMLLICFDERVSGAILCLLFSVASVIKTEARKSCGFRIKEHNRKRNLITQIINSGCFILFVFSCVDLDI